MSVNMDVDVDVDVLCRTTMPSPVGELTLVAGPRGLRAVLFPGERPGRVPLAQADGSDKSVNAILEQAKRELYEYFAGERRQFTVPLDPVGTEFQLAAWEQLRRIPYGRTISYGEQAARLGDAHKARAVGAANGRNPLSIIVPCHRVVGSTGKLTGFAAGIDTKAWLLHHEQGARSLLD